MQTKNIYNVPVSDVKAAKVQKGAGKVKKLTREQQKEQAEAYKQQFIGAVQQQLNSLVNSEEWNSSSHFRKKELLDDFNANKWAPFTAEFVDDPDMLVALESIKADTLNKSFAESQAAMDDSSLLSDIGTGIVENTKKLWSGLVNATPAAIQTWSGDMDRDYADVLRNRANDILSGKQQAGELSDEEKQQKVNELLSLANEKEASAKESYAKATPNIINYVNDLAAANNVLANRSYRQQQVDLRQQENASDPNIDYPTLATMREDGFLKSIAQLALENAPQYVAAAGTAVAGAYARVPPAVTLAFSGALLGSTDAGTSAAEQINNMSFEELAQSPTFVNELRYTNGDKEQAKQRLVSRAYSEGGTTGATIGGILGPIGTEALVTKALLSPGRKLLTGSTSKFISKQAAEAVASVAAEAPDGYLQQVASNLAVNSVTGRDVNDWDDGAVEAALLESLAAVPASGGSVAINSAKRSLASKNNTTGSTSTQQPVSSGTQQPVSSGTQQPVSSGTLGMTLPSYVSSTVAAESTMSPQVDHLSSITTYLNEVTSGDVNRFSTPDNLASLLENARRAHDDGLSIDQIHNTLNKIDDQLGGNLTGDGKSLTEIFDNYSSLTNLGIDTAVDTMTSNIADEVVETWGTQLEGINLDDEENFGPRSDTNSIQRSIDGTGEGVTPAVGEITAGITTTVLEAVNEANATIESARTGGAEVTNTTTDVGDQTPVTKLGVNATGQSTISGPNNTTDASSNAKSSSRKRGKRRATSKLASNTISGAGTGETEVTGVTPVEASGNVGASAAVVNKIGVDNVVITGYDQDSNTVKAVTNAGEEVSLVPSNVVITDAPPSNRPLFSAQMLASLLPKDGVPLLAGVEVSATLENNTLSRMQIAGVSDAGVYLRDINSGAVVVRNPSDITINQPDIILTNDGRNLFNTNSIVNNLLTGATSYDFALLRDALLTNVQDVDNIANGLVSSGYFGLTSPKDPTGYGGAVLSAIAQQTPAKIQHEIARVYQTLVGNNPNFMSSTAFISALMSERSYTNMHSDMYKEASSIYNGDFNKDIGNMADLAVSIDPDVSLAIEHAADSQVVNTIINENSTNEDNVVEPPFVGSRMTTVMDGVKYAFTVESFDPITGNMMLYHNKNDESILYHISDLGITSISNQLVTPAGRDLAQVRNVMEIYSEHKVVTPVLPALHYALNNWDLEKVDTILDKLQNSGFMEVAGPDLPSGVSMTAVLGSFNKQNTNSQAAFMENYYDMINDLPPRLMSPSAFLNQMVYEEVTNTPSTFYERLSTTVKGMLKKIASTLAAVIMAISINNMTPVNDAVADTGVGYYTNSTNNKFLSAGSNAVNNWVQQSKDNNGNKYIIADKKGGMIHIMNSDGSLIHSSPALFGRKIGDGDSVGETPAGIFTLANFNNNNPAYGGDVLKFKDNQDGSIYAIHRVLTNNKQNRIGRLNTPTPADNRISLGCINVPVDVYNKYLTKGFSGKLYVLPDQRSLSSVFKGLVENGIKEETIPRANVNTINKGLLLTNGNNPSFKSSTINQTDAASIADIQASSLSAEVAEQPELAQGNTILDCFTLGSLPLLLSRLRTRRRNRDNVNDALHTGSHEMLEQLVGTAVVRQDEPVDNTINDVSIPEQPTEQSDALQDSPATQSTIEVTPIVSDDVTDGQAVAENLSSSESDGVAGITLGGVHSSMLLTTPTSPVTQATINTAYGNPVAAGSVTQNNSATPTQGNVTANNTVTGLSIPPALLSSATSTRQYSQSNGFNWWTRVGYYMRERLVDSSTPLLKWLNTVEPVNTNTSEYDSHPVFMTYKLMSNRAKNVAEDLSDRILTPIYDTIAEVSRALGRSPDVVAKDLASYATLSHIAESNAALRASLVDNYATAAQQTYASIQERDIVLNELAEEIAEFDRAQALPGDVAPSGRVRLAAGLTDANAALAMQYIESLGYEHTTLREMQQTLVQAHASLLQMRLDSGLISTEDHDALTRHGFKNYVSLFAHKTDDFDVYYGTSLLNPAGDYSRRGSEVGRSITHNALETLIEGIHKTANIAASTPFKNALFELYQRNSSNDNLGLRLVNVNTPREFWPRGATTKRGFNVSIIDNNPDGTSSTRRYRMWFEDDTITNAIINNGRANSSGIVNAIGAVTRIRAKTLTSWRATFAPVNAVNDLVERAYNLGNRVITDMNGNRVNARQLIPAMLANAANPMLLAGIIQRVVRKQTGGKWADYMHELQQNGGVSTFNDIFTRNAESLTKELRALTGIRHITKIPSKIIDNYNEVFNLIPVLASYGALRDAGVGPTEASFRVLDAFNVTQSGTLLRNNNLSKLFVFANSTIQGGGNMLRTLGFGPGGTSARSKMKAWGMFTAGTIAYLMLHELMMTMSGDDDDLGNSIDNIPVSQLRNYIPMFYTDKDFFKAPVPYGLSQVQWVTAVCLSRISRGKMSIEDGAIEMALTSFTNIAPETTPQYEFKQHPIEYLAYSLSPSITQPLTEIVSNMTNFGTPIANKKKDTLPHDSGKLSTASVWKEMANNLHSLTGMEVYPEQIRLLSQRYLTGPLAGITSYLEADDRYRKGNRQYANDVLGPMLLTLGVNRFYGNTTGVAERLYYNQLNTIKDDLLSTGVKLTDPDNVGRKGRKEKMVAAQMFQYGYTTDQIRDALLTLQYEKEITKVENNTNDILKRIDKMSFNSDQFKQLISTYATQKETLMRAYIRQTQGGKRWQ